LPISTPTACGQPIGCYYLLIVSQRDDDRSGALTAAVVDVLLRHLPSSRPQLVRAADSRRIGVLIATDQQDVANIRQKRDYAGEFRILLPDGTVKYLEATSHHVLSASGELVEVVSTHVDVTERKRAQEALRESERSARSTIDGIAGLIATFAPNGELETVNRQVLEYFGRSLEELKNWGTTDAVHPEDLPRVVESFTRAIASGIPYHYDQRLRRFGGEYRWFDNRFVPMSHVSQARTGRRKSQHAVRVLREYVFR
jgi:PAS domain S-box-containing protein